MRARYNRDRGFIAIGFRKECENIYHYCLKCHQGQTCSEQCHQRTSTQSTWNRRENEIRRCRNEMKDLERRYRQAPDEEGDGIKQLQQMLREKTRRLRAEERTRRTKKERLRKRSQFIRDPTNSRKTFRGREIRHAEIQQT